MTNLSKAGEQYHDDAVHGWKEMLRHWHDEYDDLDFGHMAHIGKGEQLMMSMLFAFGDEQQKELMMAVLGTLWGSHPEADVLSVHMNSTITNAETLPDHVGQDAVVIFTMEAAQNYDVILMRRKATLIHFRDEDGELVTEDLTELSGINDMGSSAARIIESAFGGARLGEGSIGEIPLVHCRRFVQAVDYAVDVHDVVVLPSIEFEVELVDQMIMAYGPEEFADARQEVRGLAALTPNVQVVDNRPEARRN